jgi:hypothetical protein
MNERIRELAEQATEVSEWLSGNCSPDAPDLTKFAELLIRECANVCRDDGRWFQEQDDKLEAGVAYALCYKIKEHFGVEE